ncbi:MAG: hypothetical protein ACKVQA_26570 [Burkholderiales bacterium]
MDCSNAGGREVWGWRWVEGHAERLWWWRELWRWCGLLQLLWWELWHSKLCCGSCMAVSCPWVQLVMVRR